MIFIWIFLIIIVSIISYFLTKRSLRHYLETPDSNIPHGVFLVQNPSEFNSQLLADLASKNQGLDIIFSFERLYKGNMTALIIYGPSDLIQGFPQLNLLELDDYTNKVDVSNVLAWELRHRKSLTTKQKESKNNPKFLTNLNLNSEEELYFQVVCQSIRQEKPNPSFQVHLRTAVVAKDPIRRAAIAKDLDLKMQQFSIFTRMSTPKTSSQIFQNFSKRNIKPKQIENFRIDAEEIVKLLNQ